MRRNFPDGNFSFDFDFGFGYSNYSLNGNEINTYGELREKITVSLYELKPYKTF
jgi:hypothetical protein